jgi:hypothetical protein
MARHAPAQDGTLAAAGKKLTAMPKEKSGGRLASPATRIGSV